MPFSILKHRHQKPGSPLPLFAILSLSCNLVALPCSAQGSTTVLRDASSECSCQLALRKVTTLTDGGTEAYFDDYVTISRNATGGLFIVSPAAPYQISVFDTATGFVRTVGTAGGGPGEFRRVLPPVFGLDGRAHVLDMGTLRHSVLSPAMAFEHDATLPPIVPHDVRVLDGDTLLINGSLRTPSAAGYPFHVVADRTVVRSFGPSAQTYRIDRSGSLSRFIVDVPLDGENMITVTRAVDDGLYAIEAISQNRGDVEMRWLRPGVEPSAARPQGSIAQVPPEPRVTGAWRDNSGLLWILISTADIEYTPLVGPDVGHVVLSGDDRRRIWDSVLEVVDLDRATVLASHRFRENLYPVRGRGGLLYYYESASDGSPTFRVVAPLISHKEER